MNTVLRTMSQRLNLRIADILITLISDDPELKIGIEGATERFVVSEGDSDVKVWTKLGDLSEESQGEMLFDSGSLWQLYRDNGSYLFKFTSRTFGSVPYKVARFNLDFTSGEVTLHRQFFGSCQSIYPLEYPLDELIVLNLLHIRKGVELHACGIIDSGEKGYLFVGQSGAGKSTIARLWEKQEPITVLSDDRIVLREFENKIWMYGTPWHGEARLASPIRAPLTAVYFLEKGQRNELIAQKPSDSISRLFTCTFPPFYNRDALDFILGFIEGVVKAVPCHELRFKPDKSVVELITHNE